MSDLAERLASLSPAKRQLLEKAIRGRAQSDAPIAIVGLACRFAGAATVDDFWQLICRRGVATGEIPPSRWDVDAFYDATGQQPGKMANRWGGFVDDVDQFDPLFFGISPREAENMDPQQRLLLEVAWEALEHGAIAPSGLAGSRTGTFVGIGGVDYSRIPLQMDGYFERLNLYSGTGNALSIASNRLSYILDLRGPSLSVDTACSSGLVATHLAVHSLRDHECDMALAGGCNLILSPETTIAFSKAQMLSPDGICRPFDAGANGYVRGEGCGILVLKRLQQAVDDGDRIFAVIRGTAVNQDGRTSGIAAPNPLSQQAVIRAAHQDANVKAAGITYLEAHGTGTPLGDPMEWEALAAIFKDDPAAGQPCYVGSVKANVGHTETASGVAGVIKTVLMLQHGRVPPQANFHQVNPRISLDGTRLAIADQQRDWETDGPRLAGVSSFGFGGTNAHLVLEEAPSQKPSETGADRPLHVLTLSAKSESALSAQAERLGMFLSDHPGVAPGDVCFSANVGRSQFDHRLALVAQTTEQLQEKLASSGEAKSGKGRIHRARRSALGRPHVAFLFSGQGCQYGGMGRHLFETEPVFRDALIQCDELLEDALDVPLLALLHNGDHAERLDHTRYLQPALFAIQYSLAELWRSWGIVPDVVLGHSVGEFAAACVAGVLELEDAGRLIAERARLMAELPAGGSMAVVFADADAAAQKLDSCDGRVSLAAMNGPENTVISGETELVERLISEFKTAGIGSQKLAVSHAFHSALMEPMLDEFQDYAEMLDYEVPRLPFISTVTGEPFGDAVPDAEYWRRQVRSPVQFARAVPRLADYEPEIVLEIGPSATAIGMARRCPSPLQPAWLPSLRKGHDDGTVLLGSLAEMYVRGVAVDWHAFDRPWPRQRLSLPTYPFERKRHWYSGQIVSRDGAACAVAGASLHPLLGAAIPSAVSQRIFAASLGSRKPMFLADHQIQGSAVMPATGYVEQALAAAECLFGDGCHQVENLSIQQAMVLPQEGTRPVQTLLTAESRHEYRCEVHSSRPLEQTEQQHERDWVLHASSTLRSAAGDEKPAPVPSPVRLDKVRGKVTLRLSSEEFYARMSECGLAYGPTFQVIDELHVAGDEALARLVVPPSLAREVDAYHVHPALSDGGLQTIAGVIAATNVEQTTPAAYLPTFIRRVAVHRPGVTPAWAYVRRTSDDASPAAESVEADVLLLDDAGEVLVELGGVCLQRIGPRGGKTAQLNSWLYTLQWQQTDRDIVSSDGDPPAQLEESHWLLFDDDLGVAEHLADQLLRHGGACTMVRPGNSFRRIETDDSADTPHYEIDPLSEEDYERLLQSWQPPEGSRCGIVHCWNLDISATDQSDDVFVQSVRDRGCASLLQLVRGLVRTKPAASPSLHLVTRGAQAVDAGDVVAAAQSASWGFARVAANERPEFACRMIDLDPRDEPETAGDLLADELVAAPSNDNQVAFRGGRRWVARLQRQPEAIDFGESTKRPLAVAGPRRLQFDDTGTFDSLYYAELERATPGPGQVEIEVHSAGLNFSDVLKAMGLYPGITDRVVPLGIECAGTVTAVGDGVERFQVGDPVMGVAPYSFASHAVSAEYALVQRPECLTEEEAATIPITFLTAYYALRHLAHLRAGERVLIHAGAGGVGLAAIQIAQHVGAEVFATAGSDEKRNFLRDLGVQHVMNSRTLEFADQIMEITDGQGVDVVLNSLPGAAIDKSLSILGAYGRFLEIGKIDIYRNRMIGLLPFQDNLSYFAIDLDRMLRQRSNEIRELFEEVIAHFRDRTYRPLPMKCFRDDEVRDAFRYMAQRKNIGKIVVSFEERAEVDTPQTPSVIRNDGTYLVTGGLGALGLQVARLLARRGARYIALLGRSGPSEGAEAEIQELRSAGVQAVTLVGDVADGDSLRAAIEQIPTEFPPLRGIFHAAGVLDDALLHEMELGSLDKVIAPKIAGAWNLHRATRQCPLDHFVLFSSVAGVLGSPGQANYAAGNAFLDGLAQFRRATGLPAVSISWGPWAGGGMAAHIQDQLEARGMAPLPTDDALQVLDRALASAPPHLVVADVDWGKLVGGSGGTELGLVAHLRGEANTGTARDDVDETFCQQLGDADPEQRVALLRDYIANQVTSVLEIETNALDCEQPLAAIGFDSLMAMELKAKLETKLGQSLPMGALMENPSVLRLAEIIAPAFSSAGTSSEGEETDDGAGLPAGRTAPVVWSPLLKLSDLADTPPLVCVHPAGGDVSCYFSMARRLGTERPVWALRASGLDEQTVPHESVEQMARDYVEVIQAEHAHGPFYLAGWSTGGIFAYEMAHQMSAQRLEVAGLFLLDSPTPSILEDVDLDDHARFLVDLVEFSNWFANSQMQVDYAELKQQGVDKALHTVFEEAQRHRVLPPGSTIDYLRRLVSVCREHSRAIMQYEVKPLDQPVQLFRPANTDVLAEASGKTLSTDLGWRSILGDRVVIQEVPGDHFSMMTGENAIVLGDRLVDQIKRHQAGR